MRKSLLFLAVVSTAMYLTSCSKSDGPGPGGDVPGQPVDIKLGGQTLSVSPGTKAPIDGIPATGLTARVLASNTSLKYEGAGELIKDGTMKFMTTTTAVGFENGGVPYPHATNPVHLVGLFPTAPSADWTINSGGASAKYTFNGSHDVMATKEVETKREDGTALGTYKTLKFHHLLTRLNFTVQATDANAATAWGQVTSITVKSPAEEVTVTFEKGNDARTANAFTAADTWLNVFGIGTEAVLPATTLPLVTSTPTAQGYIMVAPKDGQTTTPVKYDMIVITDNYPAGYPVSVSLESSPGVDFNNDTQGLQFDIKLTFNATDIKAFATVEPWGTGGSGGATIQ